MYQEASARDDTRLAMDRYEKRIVGVSKTISSKTISLDTLMLSNVVYTCCLIQDNVVYTRCLRLSIALGGCLMLSILSLVSMIELTRIFTVPTFPYE